MLQLEKKGMPFEAAQKQVANEFSVLAKQNQTMRDKLITWAKSLTNSTVSDVAKGVVKLAIRSAGIPLP